MKKPVTYVSEHLLPLYPVRTTSRPWHPGLFQFPYHCQTMTEGNRGHQSVLRWHVADNVPFQTSFEACIEKYYPNQRGTLYACVACFYLPPGQADPIGSTPLGQRHGYYVRPRGPAVTSGWRCSSHAPATAQVAGHAALGAFQSGGRVAGREAGGQGAGCGAPRRRDARAGQVGRQDETIFAGIDALPSEGAAYVKTGILDATFYYRTCGAEAIDVGLKILAGEEVPRRIEPGSRIFTAASTGRGGEPLDSSRIAEHFSHKAPAGRAGSAVAAGAISTPGTCRDRQFCYRGSRASLRVRAKGA